MSAFLYIRRNVMAKKDCAIVYELGKIKKNKKRRRFDWKHIS